MECWIPELGHVIGMEAVDSALWDEHDTAKSLLVRHRTGDFGDISQDEVEINQWNLTHAGVISSAYEMRGGLWIKIVTSADRSKTTMVVYEDPNF